MADTWTHKQTLAEYLEENGPFPPVHQTTHRIEAECLIRRLEDLKLLSADVARRCLDCIPAITPDADRRLLLNIDRQANQAAIENKIHGLLLDLRKPKKRGPHYKISPGDEGEVLRFLVKLNRELERRWPEIDKKRSSSLRCKLILEAAQAAFDSLTDGGFWKWIKNPDGLWSAARAVADEAGPKHGCKATARNFTAALFDCSAEKIRTLEQSHTK